jgi:hypothetical protein
VTGIWCIRFDFDLSNFKNKIKINVDWILEISKRENLIPPSIFPLTRVREC